MSLRRTLFLTLALVVGSVVLATSPAGAGRNLGLHGSAAHLRRHDAGAGHQGQDRRGRHPGATAWPSPAAMRRAPRCSASASWPWCRRPGPAASSGRHPVVHHRIGAPLPDPEVPTPEDL